MFDLLDLTDLTTLFITPYGTANRWIPYVVPGASVTLYSNDEAASRVTATGITVPQNFTFEFDLTPVTPPADLASADKSRIFASGQDAGDNICGLMISSSQVAIVESEDPPATKFASTLFVAGTRYTVRMVVNGETNIVDVYITETASVPVIGQQLQYTSAAGSTPPAFTDGFVFTAVGTALNPVSFTLHTLRLSSSLLYPNRRPVAVCNDVYGKKNLSIVLDASGSYDPEGASLTYKWDAVSVPVGSTVWTSSLTPTYNLSLSGDVDRRPSFIPDIEGDYTFELVVNDGTLDSIPLVVNATVAPSYLSQGYTPDASALLRTISDFYGRMPDLNVLLSFWSSLMQLAASDLNILYQNHRNRSVRTLSSQISRRWIDFDCKISLRDQTFTTSLDTELSGLDGIVPYVYGTDLVANGTDQVSSATAFWISSGLRVGMGITLDVAPFQATILQLIDDATIRLSKNVPVGTGISFTAGSKRLFYAPSIPDFLAAGAKREQLIMIGGFQFRINNIVGDTIELSGEAPAGTAQAWSTSLINLTCTSDLTSYKILAWDVALWEVRNTVTQEVSEYHSTIVGCVVTTIGTDGGTVLPFMTDSAYEVTLVGFYRTSRVPVHKSTLAVPFLQEIIKDAPVVYREGFDYLLMASGTERYIEFMPLFSISSLPPATLWAEYVTYDNKDAVRYNFGQELGLDPESDIFSIIDYLYAVLGLLYCRFFGPTIENIKTGVHIFCGLPFASEAGVISKLEENYTSLQGRITIYGDSTKSNRYYIYRKSVGLSINPLTGYPYKVGDSVSQFAPLVNGVDIVDWLLDQYWFKSLGVEEIEKYSRFVVGIDVDAFTSLDDLLTILSSVLTFVRDIKPLYTDPLLVLKKLLYDEISTTDSVLFGTLTIPFIERVCRDSRLGVYGELKSDGTPAWVYGCGLPYGYASRYCPDEELTLIGETAGGVLPCYGSIHRWGDADLYYGVALPAGTHHATMWSSELPPPGTTPVKGY